MSIPHMVRGIKMFPRSMSRAYIPLLRSQSSGKPGLQRPTFCGLAPAPPPAPALLGSRAEPSGRSSASSPHCRHPQVIRGVPWSTSDWSLSWFLSPTEHLLCAQTPLGTECSGSTAAVSNRSSGTHTHCSTPMLGRVQSMARSELSSGRQHQSAAGKPRAAQNSV